MSSVRVITKPISLTQARIQNAADTHSYIKVGNKVSSLFITGAETQWKKADSLVYLPSYRLAGTKEDIITALKNSVNMSDSEIQSALQDAYTSKNYNLPYSQGGLKENFDSERSACEAYKKQQNLAKPKKEKKVPTIDEVSKQLGTANFTVNTVEKAAKKPSTGAGRGNRGGFKRIELSQRLKDLPNGKMLDVSKMAENGSGVKMVDRPQITSRTKKFYVDGVQLLSSDEEKFVQGLRLLKYSDSQIEDLRRKYQDAVSRAKPVTPVAAPAATTLAPVAIKAPTVAPAVTAAPTTVGGVKPGGPKFNFNFTGARRKGSPGK